jgi:hypothetical protein
MNSSERATEVEDDASGGAAGEEVASARHGAARTTRKRRAARGPHARGGPARVTGAVIEVSMAAAAVGVTAGARETHER